MVLENLKGKRILLASKSPRRQYLLKELGIKFEVVDNFQDDESYPEELPLEEIPVFLAKKKADNYNELLDDDCILITADTLVWCNNRVMNKPDSYGEAYQMLYSLSDNKHTVITGVCLRSAEKEITFIATTDVFFTKLSDGEIEYYLEKFKPFDKAGAYGIQEWIGYIGIEKIEGSYFNVMGLPVQKVYTELKKF
ncbi:MAG: septum formation protein Maf [Bacteroidales bacterium]|nr:septum formation protein Maf [Bacteroidales bacterium]